MLIYSVEELFEKYVKQCEAYFKEIFLNLGFNKYVLMMFYTVLFVTCLHLCFLWNREQLKMLEFSYDVWLGELQKENEYIYV